ncbi:hypothetical protein [Bartonella sp. DGB1]|uniref:hypothetical protein n=1 Tax=Bartonella sp. DGB1 TaxID=3239807 RepID=UPI00352687BA
MASEGKLTAEVMIKGLIDAIPEMQKEMEALPITLAQSFTNLGSALAIFVGKSNNVNIANRALADSINFLANNFNTLANIAISVGFIFGSGVLVRALGGITITTIEATNSAVKYVKSLKDIRRASSALEGLKFLAPMLNGAGLALGAVGLAWYTYNQYANQASNTTKEITEEMKALGVVALKVKSQVSNVEINFSAKDIKEAREEIKKIDKHSGALPHTIAKLKTSFEGANKEIKDLGESFLFLIEKVRKGQPVWDEVNKTAQAIADKKPPEKILNLLNNSLSVTAKLIMNYEKLNKSGGELIPRHQLIAEFYKNLPYDAKKHIVGLYKSLQEEAITYEQFLKEFLAKLAEIKGGILEQDARQAENLAKQLGEDLNKINLTKLNEQISDIINSNKTNPSKEAFDEFIEAQEKSLDLKKEETKQQTIYNKLVSDATKQLITLDDTRKEKLAELAKKIVRNEALEGFDKIQQKLKEEIALVEQENDDLLKQGKLTQEQITLELEKQKRLRQEYDLIEALGLDKKDKEKKKQEAKENIDEIYAGKAENAQLKGGKNDRFKELKNILSDVNSQTKELIRNIFDGKKAFEAFGHATANVLGNLASRLMDKSLDLFFNALGNSSAGSGWGGAIIGALKSLAGYSDGGYTGDGHKYQVKFSSCW